MRIIKLSEMGRIAAQLSPDEVVQYGRKSTKNESSSKSLNDQRECTLEQANDEGVPTREDRWWCEVAGHGGDEWWEGGGSSGLPGDVGPKASTRPVLTKIMTGVIRGEIKCIIVWSLDRLWRSAQIAGQAIDILREHGCLLLDHNGFVDCYSAEGRSNVLNSAVNAQNMREHCVVASPRGVRKSRDKGKLVGQGKSLGFRAVGGRTGEVQHNDEEQEVVRRIFTLYLTGEDASGPKSPDDIAELLMSEGYIWTPDLHAKRAIVRSEHTREIIYGKQIRTCLKDIRYIGMQRHDKKDWPCPALLNKGKPIVDYGIFQKVQDKIELRSTGSRASCNTTALSGRVRCGLDGLPLAKQTVTFASRKTGVSEKRSYWLARMYKGRCWCHHSLPSVRVEDLDEFIDTTLSPLLLAELIEQQNLCDPNAFAAQLNALEREIGRRQTWMDNEYPKQVQRAILGDPDAFDEETLRTTARNMKVEVDKLNIKLRTLMNTTEDQGLAQALQDMKALAPSRRIDVVRAIILWVAVLPSAEAIEKKNKRLAKPADNMGSLVFLTRWGTYFTARIFRQCNRCYLRLATPEEALGGVADFPEPENFFSGLERSYLGKTYDFDPREVTPGYEPGLPLPIAEFDVEIEVEVG